MIYIVHGEDTTKSRTLILNHQKKLANTNRVELNSENISPQQLYEACISSSLFGDIPFVVFDISEAGRSNLQPYVSMLEKIKNECAVIVYSNKSLTSKNVFIKSADRLGAKIIASEKTVEANVFKFVDNLLYKNRLNTYKELFKLYEQGYEHFYVFSMIQFGVRNLAKGVWKAPSSAKLQSFQLSKLLEQSKKHSGIKLHELFDELYILEKNCKTGKITPDAMVTMAIEKVLNS